MNQERADKIGYQAALEEQLGALSDEEIALLQHLIVQGRDFNEILRFFVHRRHNQHG